MHFKTKVDKPYWWTWRKFREGMKIQSICDYILYGKQLQWRNFNTIDIPFDTDHRMIKGKLISQNDSKKYRTYMTERKSHGIDLYGDYNVDEVPSQSDILLKTIKEGMVNDNSTKTSKDNSWISDETFNLVRKKSQALKEGNSEENNRLGKDLRRSLRCDRRNRIWKVSTFIEERLTAGDIIGAFDVLKNWYRKFTGKVLRPSRVDLECTRQTHEELFTNHNLSDIYPYEFEYD